MITDVVITIAVVSFVWCLSFISVLFLLLSNTDYKTKNSHILKSKNSHILKSKNRYSIMVLGVMVFVLIGYSAYMLFI